MAYRINFEKWNNVFAVPGCLVDEDIRLAGAVQLKVLLWILKNGTSKGFGAADISKAIGVDESDINDSIQYWELKGYLSDDNKAAPIPQIIDSFDCEIIEEKPEKAKAEVQKPPVKRMQRPDSAFITKRINESEELSWLMQEAQVILGKALSPGLSSLLISVYDDFGLPADVVMMILQYCKMKGKENTSYIEAVTRNWAEEEITTIELAEEKLKKLAEAEKAWNKVRTVLRIDRRSPSRKEEAFADKWINTLKISTELIEEAYNRCIDSTGKVSFSYMDKILENFDKKGIRTKAEADMDYKLSKAPKNDKGEKRDPTYDISDFEKIMNSI